MSFKMYALCNAALAQDIVKEILDADASLTDSQVDDELRIVQQKMTMYNKLNEASRMKKPKRPIKGELDG